MSKKIPPKTIEQLRESAFHQQLGRKFCAAFVAQQQGIQMNTALKKVEEPVGDLWIQLAETALEGWERNCRPAAPDTEEPSTRVH